jgi:hypothetical protein
MPELPDDRRDLCCKCGARQERAHAPTAILVQPRIAGVEDGGFVSGNEERAGTVPHFQGFSFSAAVGT